MQDPDSLVEYVKWLDTRFNRLVAAIEEHRSNKKHLSLPGTVDNFDWELWENLQWAYKVDF